MDKCHGLCLIKYLERLQIIRIYQPAPSHIKFLEYQCRNYHIDVYRKVIQILHLLYHEAFLHKVLLKDDCDR